MMLKTMNILKFRTLIPKLQAKPYSNMECVFKKAEIIPDVLCNAPEHEAKVVYKKAKVKLGNNITPTCTECAPKISWKKPCGRFVVMMLNPDMETRKCPDLRHWVHWLVGNIDGENVSSGETLMEYIGAVPGKDTGCHRIVFLVYKQSDKIDFCMKKICKDMPCGREKFDLKQFTSKFGLCDPHAGNFFITESDCFSEEMRNKLREKAYSGK